MALVSDIVLASLRLIGQRDQNADLMAEAITSLNNMLKGLDPEEHFFTVTEDFPIVSGTSIYTIGAGGDFNTVRPSLIISAYIEDVQLLDHKLDTQMSQIDYNRIYNKQQTGRPQKFFYNPTNPLGTIYFDLVPTDTETFFITSKKPFTIYTTLADTILEPVEYEKAMIYNLALDLAPEYNVQPLPWVIQQAQELKQSLQAKNFVPVPEAIFDMELRHI